MIVSWLILTGTAHDDFGFLRSFDCRPAACQLERCGQNWGQQTNWHIAFDFGALVFRTLPHSIFADALGRSSGVGARLGHREDGAWRVQLRRRPQIDPDGHGLGLRHSRLFIGGWSWRAGDGRCAGLCVMATDFRGPLLYTYRLGPAGALCFATKCQTNLGGNFGQLCLIYFLCHCRLGHDRGPNCFGDSSGRKQHFIRNDFGLVLLS